MKFSVHCNCLSEKIVLTGRQLDSAVSSLGWSEDGLSFALGKLHTVHSLGLNLECVTESARKAFCVTPLQDSPTQDRKM